MNAFCKFVQGFPRLGAVLLIALLSVSTAGASFLPGTVPITPGATVFPGVVVPGTDAGTLLAWMSVPFTYSTTAGTNTGFIDSAVFSDGGTLDFYYQIINDQTSSTALARETNTNLSGFVTQIGFRIDGSSLVGTGFSNGSVPPITADSSIDGRVIGFNFSPPNEAGIAPGASSFVLVISTDAKTFNIGNASVIGGGTATVAAFEPVSEPPAMALLGVGLVGIIELRRRRFLSGER